MRRAFAGLACAAIALACASSRTSRAPAALAEGQPGEATAVLLHHYEEGEGAAQGIVSGAEAARIEEQLGHCLKEALAERGRAERVVGPAELAQRVFPGVPLARMPRSPESYAELATNAEFRARMQAVGVRFLVIATGATQMPSSGGIFCFGGFGAGACFGLVIWHRDSRLAAIVIDLASGKTSQGPSTEASSHAWFAALGIFPLGMPSGFTRAKACHDFGHAVADALAGDTGENGNPQRPDR